MKKELLIPQDSDVAVICEGNTEKNYLMILLEADLLKFNENQLVKGTLLGSRYRDKSRFRDEFLTMTYDEPITLLQIQDSSRKMTFKSPYVDKIGHHYIIRTKPEIEILLIHHLQLFDEYNKVKSKEKPSQFIANHLEEKMSKLKSKSYINNIWNSDTLCEAIKMYSRKNKQDEFGLIDLLKEI